MTMRDRIAAAIKRELLNQKIEVEGVASLRGVSPPIDWKTVCDAVLIEMITPTIAVHKAGIGSARSEIIVLDTWKAMIRAAQEGK